MEEVKGILQNFQNGYLRTAEIQKIMLTAQRARNERTLKTEWNDICSILWDILQKEHDCFDDQLLLCTCFYTALPLSEHPETYMKNILKLLQNEAKPESEGITRCICLVYGLFQSSFLSRGGSMCPAVLGEALQEIFQMLVTMAYDYSRFTFIVFKVISLFKKVINSEFERYIYSNCNNVILLNLVNHNWENPITGIRDLNRNIFSTLITVIDSAELDGIIEEINGFNWNKAKFLMLSEIIEYKSNVELYLKHQDWIEGAFYSLSKPGLVSAGADMYFSMLKNLNSKEHWCSVFLTKIIKILTTGSRKTILNFCNYWCQTTFRTYPGLIDDILRQLLVAPRSETRNYSIICLWKQANKLGFLEKIWDQDSFNELISEGLENSDVQMRIFAFDIICVSKFNTMPSQEEYDLVIQFISDNVNSDSTVLRLNMLSSLKFFFIRIHLAFVSLNKHTKDSAINGDLAQFCTKLQNLLDQSLIMHGNYQRKITTLKLCSVTLKYFNEVPRMKQQCNASYSLLQALVKQGLWTLSLDYFAVKLMSLLPDPAEDIRDNVVDLLLEHYFDYLRRQEIQKNLKEMALQKIRSKFFYEINCGHTYFNLILHILIKEHQKNSTFKRVDDVFEYAIEEFFTEFQLRRDVVKSIEAGKQLHSFLAIMSAVLTACLKHKIKLRVDQKRMTLLLKYLEEISNQFVSENSNADFSEISDMVEVTIMKAGLAMKDKNASKISGIHQIVLNCMWLNVKEACVLASHLIKYEDDPAVSVQCLHIITNVLETSRHKGAMEAAGVALGQAINHLTSLAKGSPRSGLPLSLLQAKLDKLISDAADTASVTRRGAGLSILVHRIVSSDAQKGKPLFHYFMKTLLASCRSIEDVPSSLVGSDVDNERDLPKAVYIHFLTRIVNDSSLSSDIMFYSANLTELAFNHLTSKYWQIRNAALQLYGALIPKLIGQHKQSGAEDETVATVAYDEFRTHSRHLWKHVVTILGCGAKDAPAHAELVPVLNLLASCARRYNLRSDEQQEATLLQDLLGLLASPVHSVRRLAAKCVYNIFPFNKVYQDVICLQVDISENRLHGLLMLTKLYHKREADIGKFANFAELLTNMFNQKKRSFASRALYDEMFLRGNVNTLSKSFEQLERYAKEPAVSGWIKVHIVKNIQDCSAEEFPQIVKMMMNQINYEEYYELLLQQLDCKNETHLQSLRSVAKCFLDNDKHFHSEIVWKILYGSSLRIKISKISKALKYFQLNTVNYRTRYILPFLARNIQPYHEEVSKLSYLVFSLTDSETVDCDMRLIAALSNNEFSKRFDDLIDCVKINTIKTAVVLLQDEDEDIRYLNVNFYRNITKSERCLHPYICLKRMLNLDFLKSIFDDSESIVVLCNDLLKLHTKPNASGVTDQYNPFSNETNNIYKENEFTTALVKSLQRVLLCNIEFRRTQFASRHLLF